MAVSMAMTPSDHSDASDYEGERTLQPSDEDVLRDEEDTERLLDTSKKGFPSLFRDRDPNQPRELSKKDIRKQRRRERRAARRARKGRGNREDEASLMYEMEEGGERTSDDGSSTSSEDLLAEKQTPLLTRRTKLFHFTVTPIALICLFLLLAYGAYKMTGVSRNATKMKRTLRSNGTHTFGPTTILISLDGFRADFLTRGLTPTLNQFINSGVSPRYMLPSFPTVTFPNHWTMVTGLYPESHGVVGNTFWDPDLKEQFRNNVPSQSMFPKWWTSTGAEGLWSGAERQGVRTAIHMWPGSEAHLFPEASTVDKYNGSEILSRKVDRALGFLDRPSVLDTPPANVLRSDNRPEFIAVYVPDVDSDGHKFGPNSTEIRVTIKRADDMLADLFAGLEERNLTDIVNVVVVSDHGMATTSNDRLIQLEDLLDINDIEHMDGWPLYGLRPYDGVDIDELHVSLVAQAKEHGHFEVYTRETMPERYHFSSSPRIAPLWVIPEAGWAVVHKEDFDVAKAKIDNTTYQPRGLHGYDHEHPLMRAIFVARGPAFPHEGGSKLEVFQNTEVYGIVCDSLEIEPRPNNGTLRLPLKPVGSHLDDDGNEDGEEPAVDLPSFTSGTSMASTTTAVPSATPGSTTGPANGTGNGEDVETHKDPDTWETLINKIKDTFKQAKDWFKETFGGKKADENKDEK